MKPVYGSCGVCHQLALSRCTACFNVFYCGPEHQKSHWKEHKSSCKKPYVIEENATYGRFMVAQRDLKEGDVIFKENAYVTGPNLDQSSPLCLGCYVPLSKSFHSCGKCKAPLCSAKCEVSGAHLGECDELKQWPMGMYTKFESGTLIAAKKMDLELANFHLILPIRFLLLKRKDLKKYKQLMALQSHMEERRNTWKESHVREKFCKLFAKYRVNDATEDNIQKICGICDTNAFEVSLHSGRTSIIGLYPTAAMMMHSCYKNTRIVHSIHNEANRKPSGSQSAEYVMTVYARCGIAKGDVIYQTYARPFATTNMRRVMLFSGKHFGCECVRCKDPEEMGSFCSALVCQACGSSVLPEKPLDLESRWVCQQCHKDWYSGHEVAAKERNITLEWESISRTDVAAMEQFVSKHSQELHSNHALLMVAKQLISVGYGRFRGYEKHRLTLSQLERKVNLCRQVLGISMILENGIATQIGLVKYELASGLIALSQRLREDNNSKTTKDDKNKMESLLKEARVLLTHAIDILVGYEPHDNHFSLLGRTAESELTQLEIYLNK